MRGAHGVRALPARRDASPHRVARSLLSTTAHRNMLKYAMSKQGQKCLYIAMKSFDAIYEAASGNFGLVTARQSREMGVFSRELSRWVKSGRLEHVGRGVYRVSNFPASQFDAFASAVEAVGEDAYLYGESVIGMLGLTATNPTWIHVAVAHRVRRKLSDGIKVHNAPSGYKPTYYDGVRSQSVADAILSCRGTVMDVRLCDALANGIAQGYVGKDDARRVRKVLGK